MNMHRPLQRNRYNIGHRTYWTRERVINALRRFYMTHGEAITSSGKWQERTGGAWCLPPHRPYPSTASILRHFRTLRQAWTAAGVTVNRAHEDFTAEEHWYIREAAGILPREEIARDLRRTPMAVKTYLRYHGLHSYLLHGWNLHRITAATGISSYWLERWLADGTLSCVRGSKCTYVDPIALLDVPRVRMETFSIELQTAIKRGLQARLLGVLSAWAEQQAG